MAGEAVQRWRKNTKRKAVDAFGGKCCVCGYSRYMEAFDFHHLKPSEKDFSLAGVTMSPISAFKIAEELEKCVLLCANCHREVHAGIIKLTSLKSHFNKEKFLMKNEKIPLVKPCEVCGKETNIKNIACSPTCRGKRARKVNWDEIDLKSLIETNTWVDIARSLGISDNAVKKRARKLNLIAS